MPQFFTYEEYCAKYDTMAQALSSPSRTIPSWKAFESGFEALSNSLIALDDKSCEGKKGLTVGDLLIKVSDRHERFADSLTLCSLSSVFANTRSSLPTYTDKLQ